MKLAEKCVSAMVLFVAMAVAAEGSIQVAPADYAGSRTTVGTTGTGGGLVWNPADGAWSDGNFTIEWLITDNGPDFTYKYTLTTPEDGSAQLSHWILSLSEFDANGAPLQDHWDAIFVDMTAGDYSDMGLDATENEVKTHTEQQGNAGMPEDLYGVKLTRDEDEEAVTTMVSFTTPEVPIWGDFFAADGTPVYAYNEGFGIEPSDTNGFLEWIPRPDGVAEEIPGVIPEPHSVLVWSALSLLGIAVASRRIKRG